MAKAIKGFEIKSATRRSVRCTPGAQSWVARKAHMSRSHVCDVLAGRKKCNKAIWDAIAAWLAAPRTKELIEMAQEEIRHAS